MKATSHSRFNLRRHHVIAAAALTLLSGCSFSSSLVTPSDPFLKDGILALSRPVPPQETGATPGSLLGFVPAPGMTSNLWLSIRTGSGVLELMNGTTVVGTLRGEGLSELPPGQYTVLHKQKSPLWYAPDSYFSSRMLPIPEAGDKSRYLRGALGEFAIFIDKEIPLHCGPVWNADIGGVRLDEAELSKLFYSVAVGAAITIAAT